MVKVFWHTSFIFTEHLLQISNQKYSVPGKMSLKICFKNRDFQIIDCILPKILGKKAMITFVTTSIVSSFSLKTFKISSNS